MSFFIWPESSFGKFGKLMQTASPSDVETLLHTLYPSGYPVLVSSARSAIRLAHSVMGVSRGDYVSVPHYSSHCVLDVVSRSATPVPYHCLKSRKSDLVYHPWGFMNYGEWSHPMIEDAVDTLPIPGADLFQLDGDFELWSLPKILGVSSGGVLWCRRESDAEKIRKLRYSCCNKSLFWLLRQIGHRWHSCHVAWSSLESHEGGALPGIACSEILIALEQIDSLVDERKRRLELVEVYLPDWARLSEGRLPCCVPIEVNDAVAAQLSVLGFSAGFRMLEIDKELYRVFALPIHQDVPVKLISDAVALVDTCER